MIKDNRLHALALTVLAACAAAGVRAENSIQIEAEAAKEYERSPASKRAQQLFIKAAEQRLKEAKLYEKKSDDDLSTDLDDDDELTPGSGDSRMNDQACGNFVQAAKDFELAGKTIRCDELLAKARAIKEVSKKAAGEREAFEKWLQARRDPSEVEPTFAPPKDPRAKFNAARAELDKAIAENASEKKLAELWSQLGFQAFVTFQPEVCREARDAIAKLKKKPGCYPGWWLNAIEAYDALKAFPQDEAKTATPKGLASFGVKKGVTVVAGELDWDAEDATKCIQESLDTPGVTTVVLEDRGSPWFVKTIKMHSNQRLLLKKGVRILQEKVSRQLRDKSPVISVTDVENVVIEGEGGPGDVTIGKFESVAERGKWVKEELGSGIVLSGAKNVIVRNLTVAVTAQDGVCLTGIGANTKNVWIENVVLTDNYRQAMSVCNAFGLYCRNVTFANTIGTDPMMGIDFEPTYESEANSECYFYDCTFRNNAGAAVNWSSSSYYPVTAHFKRCHFLEIPNCNQIIVFARCGVYMTQNVKAPSNILFEDCDMACHADSYPIKIDNSSLFDVTVKNMKAKVVPDARDAKTESVNSPVTVRLDREYRTWGRFTGNYDFDGNEGTVTIDGFEAEGYSEPFVAFYDHTGGYSVRNVKGHGRLNGKDVDLSQFSYVAPEKDLKPIARFDPSDYLPPAAGLKATTPAEIPATFQLMWNGQWFEAPVQYRAIYADGGQWKMKKIQMGQRELELDGKPVAYYIRSADSVLKACAFGNKPFTVYFEVPGGRQECLLKVIWGLGELKNAKGEVVHAFKWPEARSSQYATCKTEGEASEIWSITFTSDGAKLKFFAPFSGIVAEDPAYLPRRK